MGPSWATRQALPPSRQLHEPAGDGACVHGLRQALVGLLRIVGGHGRGGAFERRGRVGGRRGVQRRLRRAGAHGLELDRGGVRLGVPRRGAGVAVAHRAGAGVAAVVHAERLEDVDHGGVRARLEIAQRLAVGQRRAVGVGGERRGQVGVGLELLPGASLIVAQRDLAQARVQHHFGKRPGDVFVTPRRDDVLRRHPRPRQVAGEDGHGSDGRETLRGRSRLVLPERREPMVALAHQRAADVARRLAVADEIELHVRSSVICSRVTSPGRRRRSP